MVSVHVFLQLVGALLEGALIGIERSESDDGNYLRPLRQSIIQQS
jgi:hypothetical protein